MQYRQFGRTGWKVSEVGYGMWGMGSWLDSDDQQSMQSLQLAVDLGCNFFDTAWAYGSGKSERFLGRLVKANPDKKLYTATKIPPMNLKWPSRREFTAAECFPPDHIERYVAKSLENAGIGAYDLVQFHTWEDSWLQDDNMVKTMRDMRDQGYFRAIGVSINRWEPWNGIEAVRSGFADAVQVIYNIFDQNPEDELFPACVANNVGVIARVPFDEGSLTGNLTRQSTWPAGDWRNTYFVPENLGASVDRADALRPLLKEGMTMPEMALRFILGQDAVSTVIPGMRKADHVRMNIGMSDAGQLSDDLISELKRHRWDRTPTTWSQ